MVDKAIVSPKVSGGAHVQVPVTMWENMGNREIVYKSSDGWKKISQEQYNKLTEDEKKKRDYMYFHPNREFSGKLESLKLKKVDDGTFIDNGYR
jgi:hypothetical protein